MEMSNAMSFKNDMLVCVKGWNCVWMVSGVKEREKNEVNHFGCQRIIFERFNWNIRSVRVIIMHTICMVQSHKLIFLTFFWHIFMFALHCYNAWWNYEWWQNNLQWQIQVCDGKMLSICSFGVDSYIHRCRAVNHFNRIVQSHII